MAAEKNAFVIISKITGQHFAHVVDAENPHDPYWLTFIENEHGHPHHQIHIHKDHYNSMSHEDLHTHVAAEFIALKRIP